MEGNFLDKIRTKEIDGKLFFRLRDIFYFAYGNNGGSNYTLARIVFEGKGMFVICNDSPGKDIQNTFFVYSEIAIWYFNKKNYADIAVKNRLVGKLQEMQDEFCNKNKSNIGSQIAPKNETHLPVNNLKCLLFHEAARLLTEQNMPIRRACWEKGVYMIGEKVGGKYRLSMVNKNNAIFNTDWWANDWEIFVRYPELEIDAANTNEDGGLAYHKTLLLIDNNKEAAKVLIKLPDLVAKPFLMRFLPVLFAPENAGNKIEIQADDDTLRKVEKFVENFNEL